jgi:hypothetical protein
VVVELESVVVPQFEIAMTSETPQTKTDMEATLSANLRAIPRKWNHPFPNRDKSVSHVLFHASFFHSSNIP